MTTTLCSLLSRLLFFIMKLTVRFIWSPAATTSRKHEMKSREVRKEVGKRDKTSRE